MSLCGQVTPWFTLIYLDIYGGGVSKHWQPLDILEEEAEHCTDISDGVGTVIPAKYSEQKDVAVALIMARKQLSCKSVSFRTA